jgi:uncharacterized membrane protein YqjE
MTDEETGPVETAGGKGGGSMSGSAESGREKPGIDFMIGLRLIVLLLVLIAAVQLYLSIQGIIAMWVANQFIPLVSAVYYLVVIIGGIWLLKDVLTKR